MSSAEERFARIRAAVNSLSADTCVCGAKKERRRCFCRGCYYALPATMRRALWQQVTHGFEDAYEAAVKWLEGRRVRA